MSARLQHLGIWACEHRRKFLTYSLGSLAELDTQFLIAEMQGYAKYTDELKAKVVGLMAGIRVFSATLSKA